MIFHRHRHRVRQLRQPATTDFIVSVDDGLAAMVGGVQQPFRRFVVRHVAMVVEVVAAQVGKYRGSKLQGRHAVLHQPVGRDFHRAEGCPLLDQTGKHVLNIDRRTGGVFARDHFIQQAVADGPHHRAGFAEQFRPLRQKLGGGGFAVGTGHAHQTQLLRRLMIKTPGQRR